MSDLQSTLLTIVAIYLTYRGYTIAFATKWLSAKATPQAKLKK